MTAVKLAVAVAVAFGAAPGAASAAGCGAPIDGGRQRLTASSAEGLETTTTFGRGLYRVTRCDSHGRFLGGMTVGPIRNPNGAFVLVPLTFSYPDGDASVTYGDPRDPAWIAAWHRDGARTSAMALRPAPGADIDLPTAAASASREVSGKRAKTSQGGDSCTNHQFLRYGASAWWSGRYYAYRVNVGSFGNNDTTRSALVSGHHNWDWVNDDCNVADWNNLTSDYLGTSAGTASSTANGESIIDKGQVSNIARCGNSTTFIACAWQFPGQATGPYSEADQRYDIDYAFTNTGAANAYDYQAVATHETGHTIGLDHANSSANLTMFWQASLNSTSWRTLAIGDVDGMRNIYP